MNKEIIKYDGIDFDHNDPLRAQVNTYPVSITYKIRAKAGCFYRRYKVNPSKLFLSVTLGDQLLVEMFTNHPEIAHAASGNAKHVFTFDGMKIYRVVEPDVVEVA